MTGVGMRFLLFALVAPLNAFMLAPTIGRYASKASSVTMHHLEGEEHPMPAPSTKEALYLDVVSDFVAATERGDAAAAMELCTEDFFYKTHRATTESLAAAEERLHTKVPAPTKIKVALHEESCKVEVEEESCVLVRDIVVKPVPFITVNVRQEFEVRDGRISRAEFIKQ